MKRLKTAAKKDTFLCSGTFQNFILKNLTFMQVVANFLVPARASLIWSVMMR